MTDLIHIKRAWFRDPTTGITVMVEIASRGEVDWHGISQLSAQGDATPWIQIREPTKGSGRIKASGWTPEGVRALLGQPDVPKEPTLRLVNTDSTEKPG